MTCAWSTFRLAFRAQVPEKFQRPQNGDVAKRGHRKKIPATRDEAVRFSCPCSLEKFIVVRITAAQYGSFDQHPFRDDLELPEEEGSAFSTDVGVEFRPQESRVQFVVRLPRKQQDSASVANSFNDRTRSPVGAECGADEYVGVVTIITNSLLPSDLRASTLDCYNSLY